MPARLILNADDFGLTPGINRAIRELHQAGAVTSATLIANGAAFEDAVITALAIPTLGVGCHIVFVDGSPISEPRTVPSLLSHDGKSFRHSLLDFSQALLRGNISTTELVREARAQIERLQRAGIHVTHVDTHKHTHALPAVARAVVQAARQRGIDAIRFPFEPKWSTGLAPMTLSRRLQVALLRSFQQRVAAELATGAALPLAPSGTLGIAATGDLTPSLLRRMLLGLCTGHDGSTFELCCHPGYVDPALHTIGTRLRSSRELENHTLLAVIPEISQHPNAPRLIHYGDRGELRNTSSAQPSTRELEKVL